MIRGARSPAARATGRTGAVFFSGWPLRGVGVARPFFLEALKRAFAAVRVLFGLAESILDNRLNGGVAAAAIGAATEAFIDSTRRARGLLAVKRVPDFRFGNCVAGTDNHSDCRKINACLSRSRFIMAGI